MACSLCTRARRRVSASAQPPIAAAVGRPSKRAVAEAGVIEDWRSVVEASSDLYDALAAAGWKAPAAYAVAMAYRVRFYMHMNAREAMQVIELRTAPQGHPAYRRVQDQF